MGPLVENCSSCTSPLRLGMKFCPRCGVRLHQVGSKAIEASAHHPESPGNSETQPATPSKLPRKRVWVLAASFSALIVGATIAIAFASQSANVSKQEQMEKLAAACALQLQPFASEISSGTFYYDLDEYGAANERISVEVLDADGRKIGSYLTCEYSVDWLANAPSVESATWRYVVDGREYEIEYDGKSNRISSALAELPVLLEESPSGSEELPSKSAGDSKSCEEAFKEAASVPLSQDNNDEIRETTWSCADVDEWWAMLKRYPATFGVSNFLESEKGLYVGSACLVGQGSPVCQDAARLGLTL